MADTKISAESAASALGGTEVVPGVQSGANVKITANQIKTLTLAGATTTLGAADAAAPVAQTLGVQSVVGGTSNTAGVDWTIAGSKGTGTGAGGNLVFKVAPAGGAGSSQNALTPGAVLRSDGIWDVSTTTTSAFQINNAGTLLFYAYNGNIVETITLCPRLDATYDLGTVPTGGFNGGWNNLFVSSTAKVAWNNDAAISRNAAGVLEVNNGTAGTFASLVTKSVRGAAVTFANVPATAVEGMMVAVTDSTTATWGATITGTGSNHVLAYYNGTNWTVAAI